jgi:hypothetical protein
VRGDARIEIKADPIWNHLYFNERQAQTWPSPCAILETPAQGLAGVGGGIFDAGRNDNLCDVGG